MSGAGWEPAKRSYERPLAVTLRPGIRPRVIGLKHTVMKRPPFSWGVVSDAMPIGPVATIRQPFFTSD